MKVGTDGVVDALKHRNSQRNGKLAEVVRKGSHTSAFHGTKTVPAHQIGMSSQSTPASEPAVTARPGPAVVRFGFDNTFARLPERLCARLSPTPVASPRLVRLNVELACWLGLDAEALGSREGVEILAGNRLAE